ncbi:hypothetical protein DFH94DRAFT_690920 [Russula ochroleuca]|uniref:Uncharacterized protein n=1 Tax=Russula ochroleuca TaxID=152965 RepID=A0A9P5MZV7_9AGAM|nr:hypothetical protein DFH94DRAFT_690920 [Russula ochroleuca]
MLRIPGLTAPLHILVEVSQSSEALSPVSTASLALTPTFALTSVPHFKERRKPLPLIASSPIMMSSIEPLDSALRPSPAASTNASSSSGLHDRLALADAGYKAAHDNVSF